MFEDHATRLLFAFGGHGVTLLLDFVALVLVVIVLAIVRLISVCRSLWRRSGDASVGPHSQRRTSSEFYVDYRPVSGRTGASAASREDR